MTDVTDRAVAALATRRAQEDAFWPRKLVEDLLAEVERLRSYKSLPPGMVWQDYYSPDDAIKIREPLDAEIERLRGRLRRYVLAMHAVRDALPGDVWPDD